uniref:Putative mitochondrial protein n=1 Tax=Tanacetum cinerariifolium TaxID=118510 RepID=A0A6L2KCC1_TANCI|nr:putative mitochondrial protein [Tanacetum cinerariifolium]
MVGANDVIRRKLVDQFHRLAKGGHLSVLATTQRLKNWFYWKGIRKTIKQVVSQCDVCHINKADFTAYPGLLQPLPILEKMWQDISMAFMDRLPMSNGKFMIMVVVDRLRKYAQFIPMSHPYTVTQLKKCKSNEAMMGSFPHYKYDGLIVVTPSVVLDLRMVKKKNKEAVGLLIQWANYATEDAT